MTVQERRVKVIEKILEDTINDQVAMEVGVEIKTNMLLTMGDHPQAPQVEQAIQQEKFALAEQPKVIAILQKKLEEAQNAVLRGNAS